MHKPEDQYDDINPDSQYNVSGQNIGVENKSLAVSIARYRRESDRREAHPTIHESEVRCTRVDPSGEVGHEPNYRDKWDEDTN